VSEETTVEKSLPKSYIVLIGFAMFFLPITLFLANHLLTVTFEKTPPEITLVDIPRGVGAVPVRLTGLVKDQGSGVKFIKVLINQGQLSLNLLSLEQSGKEVPFEVRFDEKLKPIEDGDALLVIEAKDNRNNQSKREFRVLVDRKRPRATLALPLPNRLDGTPELCFIVAEDENLEEGSIRGRTLYKGTALDSSLKNVFVVWAPNRVGKETKVFFEDSVGNVTSVDCTSTVEERKRAIVKGLNTNFPDAAELAKKLEEELKRESNVSSISNRVWSDFFSPLSKGKQLVNFGDLIFDSYESPGVIFAPNDSQKEIVSPSNGIVRKIFDHSGYGKTLVVDYGLDLIGTISGFKSLEVKAGDSIRRGDFLGVADKIPLTNETHILFTLRIGEQFVDPKAFFDSSTYLQMVPKRIGAIKRLFDIPITNPLEK
jgi:hypothetical protein